MKKSLLKTPHFKYNLLYSLIVLSLQPAYAGVVRDDVDYQQYRDFSENRGQFHINASNVVINNRNHQPIKDVNGEPVTLFNNHIKMPDWSAVNTRGTADDEGKGYTVKLENGSFIYTFPTITRGHATLVHPQYVAGAAHVGIGQHIGFGSHTHDIDHKDQPYHVYHLVDANNFPYDNDFDARVDFYQPRLHKLVTEVVPIDTVDISKLNTQDELTAFQQRYPLLLRIGAGKQQELSNGDSEPKNIHGATSDFGYKFLTGGQVANAIVPPNGWEGVLVASRNVMGLNQPQMGISVLQGDSGSPVYAYDTQDKKWKLLAVVSGYIGANDYFTLYKTQFATEKRNEDNNVNHITNHQVGKEFNWRANGRDSEISSGNEQFTLPIYDEHESTDKAKLNHGKNLNISGSKGTLNLESDIHQGAGALYFETDFTVKSDTPNITWTGAGVSVEGKNTTVTWQVKNPQGDRLSKIGEGTLHINGEGNNLGDLSVGDGKVILNQTNGLAFNHLVIVSGRPIVQLAKDGQINPNNITFGYRGGRLDVNGHNLTFDYIKNIDEQAMIVNHHPHQSANITIKSNASNHHQAAFNGVLGETDPTHHNGQLNVIYNPDNPQENKPFLFSGSLNLHGDFITENGHVVLSGRPTPHAYDHIHNFEPFRDDDWIDNRHFNATNLIIKNNARLDIGRGVSEVNANIHLKNNATAQIGFINKQTPVCVRSDYFGTTNCSIPNYDANILNTINSTHVTGNIILNDHTQMTIGKAHWVGKAKSNQSNSQLTLTENAKWTMTANSSLGNLAMEQGAQITLNAEKENQPKQFNTLTIEGNLSGNGQFNYLTNVSQNQGDKVIVNGTASGNYVLNVKDSGQEPNSNDLVLFATKQADANLNVTLKNTKDNTNYVDLGAWRYELVEKNQKFALTKQDKPSDDKPSDDKPSDDKPSDDKPSDDKPSDDKPSDDKPSDDKPSDDKPSDDKPSDDKPSDDKPSDDKPSDDKPSDDKPSDDKPSVATATSKYTNAALSAQSAQIDGTLYAIQQLNQRLWDIPEKGRGLWLHTEYTKQKKPNATYRNYEYTQQLFQFGVDKDVLSDKGTLLVGAALSQNNGEQTFTESSGKSRLLLGSIYGKWFTQNQAFFAVDGGYGVAKQNIKLDDSESTYTQNVAHLGVSTGKTWQWNDFSVQPAIGVRYHHFSDSQYHLNGAKIVQPKLNLMAYQAGLRLSHSWQNAFGADIKPYYRSTYTHLSGDAQTFVNQYHFTVPMNRHWQHQLGLEVQKGRWGTQIYANYEHGKKQEKRHAAGMMLHYRW